MKTPKEIYLLQKGSHLLGTWSGTPQREISGGWYSAVYKYIRADLVEQKTAEWSEEDKMHLNNAILAAEKEWGAESCTAKFLKSLRPSWKPSEEQPMPDSTQLIAEWEKEKAVLKQKDFRGDAERMAYNAFLDGFVKGIGYGCTK